MKLTSEFLSEMCIDHSVSPDGAITVDESLELADTGITALPDNLTVGHSLCLRATAIKVLPNNLTVGSYLYLPGKAIMGLPDGLKVGRVMYGAEKFKRALEAKNELS